MQLVSIKFSNQPAPNSYQMLLTEQQVEKLKAIMDEAGKMGAAKIDLGEEGGRFAVRPEAVRKFLDETPHAPVPDWHDSASPAYRKPQGVVAHIRAVDFAETRPFTPMDLEPMPPIPQRRTDDLLVEAHKPNPIKYEQTFETRSGPVEHPLESEQMRERDEERRATRGRRVDDYKFQRAPHWKYRPTEALDGQEGPPSMFDGPYDDQTERMRRLGSTKFGYRIRNFIINLCS